MQKLQDLKKRFLVSIVLIIFFVTIIFFSNLVFMRYVFLLLLSFVAFFASKEFMALVEAKKIELPKKVLAIGIIGEILAFFLYSQYPVLKILPLVVFFLVILFLFLSSFNKIENAISRIAISSLGLIYLAFPIGLFCPILYMKNFNMQDGRYWIFYLIFVTKITDIGAYFGGKIFGKKKLAEKISPKKTVFGSVTGIIFAFFASLLFLYFAEASVFNFDIYKAVILGLVIGLFAQIGDLCESLLKRDARIKDSNKIPGMGGVLDILDSLIFNIPILYFVLL